MNKTPSLIRQRLALRTRLGGRLLEASASVRVARMAGRVPSYSLCTSLSEHIVCGLGPLAIGPRISTQFNRPRRD